MPQNSVMLKASGLNTFSNQIGPANPQGALQQADNVVIYRDGVIEPCRGFKLYGDAMGISSSIVAKQLASYKTRIIRHFQTTLEWDNGSGTFTAFSGTFSETETGLRIKSIEANGNFYLTTSSGIKKISATSSSTLGSATISDAGGVKALDNKLELNTDPGFLPPESVVAYRIVWGIKDNNNNIILGVPSQREVITNPLVTLMASDFNNLLAELDIAAPLSAGDDLSDTNYVSTLAVASNASITTTRTAMSSLCSKLDTDLGGTPFSSIKTAIDAITFSTPPTSAQQFDLQEQFDAIVDQLNSYIGSGGSPTITNSADSFTNSTSSSSVDIEITIPEAITTAYFFQVYRTAVSQSTGTGTLSDLDPGDEMGLVYEANPSSGDITSGYVSITDVTPEAFRGANLYTNPNSGEGISQANEVPPKAKDMALYKNYLFYANTETRYRKQFSLLSVSGLTANTSRLTITNGTTTNTYVFGTTENISTISLTGDTTSASNSITNISTTANLLVGMAVSGSGIPANTLIASIAGPTSITISNNATATATGVSLTFQGKQVLISTLDTPSQQVEETARSLVHVINRIDGEIVYAYYLSGPTDVPGMILLESRNSNSPSFYVNSSESGMVDQFSPNIPMSGQTFIGDNEVSPNRVYYSKVNQPEAVPLLNYFDVGPKDKKILRVVALRESLYIFKQEAIYRVSGDVAPFVLNLSDSSTILTAPDTADILNNEIYCLTSQGVAKVSDGGVSIISRPIENLLIKLNTPNYLYYSTASFGKGYESDRTYYLWTVTRTTDTLATQCFTYNTFTNSWCRRPISKTCAIISPSDDKMYLGAGDINYIEQERKDFLRTDHANREYTQTLGANAVDGTIITLPSVANVSDRDVILQEQYLTIAQFNRILSKLDIDAGVSDTNYSSTLSAISGSNLRTKLTSLAQKLDLDSGVADTNYASTISAYTSSFADTQTAFNTIVTKLNADTGVLFSNYPSSSGTTNFETIILSVDDNLSSVTIENEFPFVVGPIITYAHIASEWTWAPQYFQDPSNLKQVSEGTVLFEKITFSTLDLSFSSDLSPGFESVSFEGSGNGIYGNGVYGENNYGGSANATPFRTYVPRNKQRCRYLNCKVTHATAREAYSVFGLSLVYNISSTRAYR